MKSVWRCKVKTAWLPMVKQRQENTFEILVRKYFWEKYFSDAINRQSGNCNLRTLLLSLCKTQSSDIILMSASHNEWCTRKALYTFKSLHGRGIQIQSYLNDTTWDRCPVTIFPGNFLLGFDWKLCLQRIYASDNYYLCVPYAWKRSRYTRKYLFSTFNHVLAITISHIIAKYWFA